MIPPVVHITFLVLLVMVSSSCVCNKEMSSPPALGDSTSIAARLVALLIALGPNLSDTAQQFAILTGSMFEANAIFSGRKQLTSVKVNIPANFSEESAIAYAGYAALIRTSPAMTSRIDAALNNLGFPDRDLRDTFGMPITAAIESRYPLNLPPLRYTPPNRPSLDEDARCETITDPDGWQPLCIPPAGGGRCAPQMVPFIPFYRASLISADGGEKVEKLLRKVPPPPLFNQDLRDASTAGTSFTREYETVLRTFGGLNDREKITAEVFAPNVITMTHNIAVDEVATRGLDLRTSVRVLFTLSAAIRDTFVAAVTSKLKYSSVRPITVLQCGYRGQTIKTWKGPYQGVQTFENTKQTPWVPYILTPPFPGYVSGHSAVASSAAQILTKFFGRRPLGANCITVKEGESKIEPRIDPGQAGFMAGLTNVPNRGARSVGYTPARDTTICWSNFRGYARLVAVSRIFGGVHVPIDNTFGRVLGRDGANMAFNFVKRRG